MNDSHILKSSKLKQKVFMDASNKKEAANQIEQIKYGKLKGIQKIPVASSKSKAGKFRPQTINLELNDENLER